MCGLRCHGAEVGEVLTIHREDQVEAVEIGRSHLPRTLGRKVRSRAAKAAFMAGP